MERRLSKGSAQVWDRAKQLFINFETLKSGDELNVKALCQTLWKCRDKVEIAEALVDLLKSESARRNVFIGVESFLPQFAHMMIHCTKTWPTNTIALFCYALAQQSLHFAISIYFLVFTEMQDLAPTKSGVQGDAEGFLMCASILYNIERAVVYGSDDLELEIKFKAGEISQEEFEDLRMDQKFKSASDLGDAEVLFQGSMLHKVSRVEDDSKYRGKWVDCLFQFKYNLLLCFDIESEKLVKAMPMLHTKLVGEMETPDSVSNYFEIHEGGSSEFWQFQCPNATAKKRWFKALEGAIDKPPQYEHAKGDNALTEEQLGRFQFFRSQVEFVQGLAQIPLSLGTIQAAKGLRKNIHKELNADMKDMLANLKLDTNTYNPLLLSAERFVQIQNVSLKKCRMGFTGSSQEVIECLFAFQTKTLEEDVANILHKNFSKLPASYFEDFKETIFTPFSQLWTRKKRPAFKRPSVWITEDEDPLDGLGHTQLEQKPNQLFLVCKGGVDLRPLSISMQILSLIKGILSSKMTEEPLLTPLRVFLTGTSGGIQEMVLNSRSLSGWKSFYAKQGKTNFSLIHHFRESYEKHMDGARTIFARSLAVYAVSMYVLGIGDQDETNILLHESGRLVFTQTGSMFGYKNVNSPFSRLFENDPFKLRPDFEDLISLPTAVKNPFDVFVDTCVEAFTILRSASEEVCTTVELLGFKSKLSIFSKGTPKIVKKIKERMFLSTTEEKAQKKLLKLIQKGSNHPGSLKEQYFKRRMGNGGNDLIKLEL